MKELIKANEYGVFVAKKNEETYVDSRLIAKYFGKEHKNVLQSIDNTIADLCKCIENIEYNECSDGAEQSITENSAMKVNEYKSIINEFVFTTYKKGIQEYRYCNVGRKAFDLLVMCFTGVKALAVKVEYIKQFEYMRSVLTELNNSKLEHAELSNSILKYLCDGSGNDKFRYSNEYNMVYKLVLGKTAQQFRRDLGLDKQAIIKPYLNKSELSTVNKLMTMDANLIKCGLPREERKELLCKLFDEEGINV